MPSRPVIDPEAHEKCVLCHNDKDDTHHIDGDRSNNSPKNKLPVCSTCQSGIHNGYGPKYLPWFYQLDPSSRHSKLPRVGRQTERSKQKRARLMHQRLSKAFTAERAAYEEATDTGHYLDLALNVQRKSFFYDFRLLPVSKKWDDGHYEFRPHPVVLEETDEYGYVVRLLPFDAPDDVGPTRAAYEEFAESVNAFTSYSVGPLTLTDGQPLPPESSLRRATVSTQT